MLKQLIIVTDQLAASKVEVTKHLAVEGQVLDSTVCQLLQYKEHRICQSFQCTDDISCQYLQHIA